MYQTDIAHVQSVNHPPSDTLTFSSNDIQDIHYPHDDPLVVTLTIANYAIKRVLVNARSSLKEVISPSLSPTIDLLSRTFNPQSSGPSVTSMRYQRKRRVVETHSLQEIGMHARSAWMSLMSGP